MKCAGQVFTSDGRLIQGCDNTTAWCRLKAADLWRENGLPFRVLLCDEHALASTRAEVTMTVTLVAL